MLSCIYSKLRVFFIFLNAIVVMYIYYIYEFTSSSFASACRAAFHATGFPIFSTPSLLLFCFVSFSSSSSAATRAARLGYFSFIFCVYFIVKTLFYNRVYGQNLKEKRAHQGTLYKIKTIIIIIYLFRVYVINLNSIYVPFCHAAFRLQATVLVFWTQSSVILHYLIG